MFDAIRAFLMTEELGPLIKWLLQPGAIGEVLKRASIFMGMPDGEGGWGLFDSTTESPRPAFTELANLFQ